jgi:hypothetical protein
MAMSIENRRCGDLPLSHPCSTRLTKIGATYEFHDLDKELKSQGWQSKCLRRYALHEEAITLHALLTKARILEVGEFTSTPTIFVCVLPVSCMAMM